MEAKRETFGFVDTLDEYPTFWSFDSGGLKKLSNQYASMPSLHMAWALWSMLVLLPLVRRRWLRFLIVLDPIATFLCIIVTANHYWLDAFFGIVTFAVAYGIARVLTDWWDERHPTRVDDPRTSVAPDGRGSPPARPSAHDRRATA